MSKILKLFLNISITLLFFLVTTSHILALEGDILFFDDFNDGNFNGWTIESGNWYVYNGNLLGDQSGRAYYGRINTGSSEWDNYRIEADVYGYQGVDQNIGLRYTANGSYEINLRYGTGPYDTPQVKLWRISNGQGVMVADTHSYPLRLNNWYHVKIEAVNENIKVWIENTLILDFIDPDTNIKKGVIGLSYWTGDISIANMRFDNIKVTALAPPPTPTPTPAPTKTPLILIPGIGGSELKSNLTFTSEIKDCGILSPFTYNADEIVWVNTVIAGLSPCDDYFDVLKLKNDGQTPEYPQIALNGTVYQDAYRDLIAFFTENGYELDKTLFIYPYDWRKDISLTADPLNNLINSIKQQSGHQKVDIIAHSMGGLVAKNYIANSSRAQNVRKLITLGTPYLGSVKLLKALRYGDYFGEAYLLGLLSLNPDEIKDVVQNFTGVFELLPSQSYFEFYDNSNPEYSFPFRDDSDIDKNGITGALNFDQVKQLLTYFGHNMNLFNLADNFHSQIDKIWQNSTNDVETSIIVGSAQPTLLQLHEQNKIKFHFDKDTGLQINKREEIFGNGDGTVPLYSASLIDQNQNLDFTGQAKTYFVNQEHGNLTSRNAGPALNLAKNILEDKSKTLEGVQDNPYKLKGKAIIVQSPVELHVYDTNGRHTGPTEDGNFEANIPGSYYDSLESSKFVWLPDNGQYKIQLQATDNGSFDLKIRSFEDDINNQTTLYKDIPITNTTQGKLDYDPSSVIPPILYLDNNNDGVFENQFISSSILTGDTVDDQISPTTTVTLSGQQGNNGWFRNDVTVTLEASDDISGSDILKTEYIMNDGQTINQYTTPFIISQEGITKLQVKSTDKAGNEEFPLPTIDIKIDKTPPEALVQFNLQTQNLEINGQEINPGEVILTDEAGNTTKLSVEPKEKKRKEKLEIKTISYNDGPITNLPDNKFEIKFKLDKNNKIEDLDQTIKIKGEEKIKAKYNPKKDTTRIEIKEQGEKKRIEERNGIILLQLLTNKGELGTDL